MGELSCDGVLTTYSRGTASLVYGPKFACVTMPAYIFVGSRCEAFTDPGSGESPYASRLLEVCTDFGKLVFHLSVSYGRKQSSVDQRKRIPLKCVLGLKVPEEPSLRLHLKG